MKTSHIIKTTIIKLITQTLTAAAVALLLTGCHPQRAESPAVAKADSPPAAPSRNTFYLTCAETDCDTSVVFQEATLLSPHRAKLDLVGLALGKAYEARWRLQDGDGKVIVTDKFPFTPTTSGWSVWFNFQPDYKTQKAGKWRWTVEIPGVGRHALEFTMLPPTPSQLRDLALHEQAREEVFRAFAQYWLNYSGHYFTTVVAHSGAVPRHWNQFSSEPPAVTEAVSLLQVSGLDYRFDRGFVSDADRLNGISYRGSAAFGFNVYRFFTSDGGWSDWKDAQSYGGPFAQALAQMFGGLGVRMPSNFRGDFNLSFTIEQKDGHWRILADGGDLFVNGKRIESATASPKKTEVIQPRLDFVQQLAGGLGTQRNRDRLSGDSVKASPEEIGRNTITTMTALRGRSL